jgi:hypothetical protein
LPLAYTICGDISTTTVGGVAILNNPTQAFFFSDRPKMKNIIFNKK